MSIPRPAKSPWWQFPVNWWWRSLPLRVIASVLVASVIVLVLGGFLLMKQATNGVLDGKKASVTREARAVVDNAQQRLNATDQSVTVNPDELLTDLATNVVNRPGGSDQYEVVLITSNQTIRVGRVEASSIPESLRQAVANSNDMYVTPTTITYSDGRPSIPGLAVGSSLTLPGSTGRYEIYFAFPLTQEATTLTVLRNSVISTGALLVVMLTLIAALVSRQVVTPVRAARRAAESLASGNLDDRMKVRGQDDLARLATSMNYMASELQKQINQLEELSRVQQRFVSDVSHELRTPLTTVRMAAEVLHEGRDQFDPISARSAELLQTELDRFEALLTDLLEISRFDAGAAVLAIAEVDLRDIVARVVDQHARFAIGAGAEVTVHSPGPITAEVDGRRIERIIRNLLVNAIEHSEGRPIDILMDTDEDAVAVAVRDHGVGFEANQARQVFHRFWRADPARARTMGGTGLGLSISMEDARLHGGWLTAWGRPGMGAQFRLTLPRRAGAILEQSPLPLVPRDLVGPSVARLDGLELAQPLVAHETGNGAPMTRAPRRSWPVVLVLLLGLLTACVTVPTSGPVTKAGGEAPGCLECVDVDVSPPSAGAEPKQIVDGYLRAMSNYQPNYSVARQFLTSTSAQSWVPEEGTSIYTGTTSSSASDTVLLEGRLVASLDSHRTYTARDEAFRRGFTLVQENGEWRISDPPKGLLVAQYSFTRFYRPFDVYFVGNGKTLVPDPVYLPPRVNEATVLVQTLLDGASTWLKPAVTSAIPTTTTLQVSVTVKDGVAEVTLSDSVLPLSNDQRALMAAQIVYTLDQVEGVTKVLLLVGQQPFSVPGADPNDFTVSREALSPDVQPVPYNAAEAYYGVTAKGVTLIDPSSGTPTAVPGPLGTRGDVKRLAVSVTNTTLAVVTDDSTVLREGSGGKLTTVLSGGVSQLLRPQFDRYDQLWAVGREDGRQKMWVVGGADPVPVGGDVATAGGITAFKISPDGVRMALIRTVDGRSELGIARISRTDGGFSVDGWRTLSGPASGDDQVTDLVDLAWSDAKTLVVLAATTQNQKVGPYSVSQDAFEAASLGVPSGDPKQVAVTLKTPQTTVLVGGGDSSGQTWRDDGTQRWSPFVQGLTTFAFPD